MWLHTMNYKLSLYVVKFYVAMIHLTGMGPPCISEDLGFLKWWSMQYLMLVEKIWKKLYWLVAQVSYS